MTAFGLHFLAKQEEFKRVAMNKSVPKTRFNAVRATTCANTDRTPRCLQDAGIAGLQNITLGDPAANLIRRVLRFYVLCWSLKSRLIQFGNKIWMRY